MNIRFTVGEWSVRNFHTLTNGYSDHNCKMFHAVSPQYRLVIDQHGNVLEGENRINKKAKSEWLNSDAYKYLISFRALTK